MNCDECSRLRECYADVKDHMGELERDLAQLKEEWKEHREEEH